MLSGKTLKRLVLITSICAIPVIFLVVKSGASSISNKNAAFLPTLLNKPEQISKIIMQDNKSTLTLEKHENKWHVVERNNYVVLNEKVDELLYSLADLRIIEPKTSNPELYKQLDVNDLSDPNSETLLITITDVYNDNIAKLYIGKRETVQLGEQFKERLFVRNVGDEQAWLVQGTIASTNQFSDWVDQPLLGLIDSDQIKSVEIERVDSPKLIITKREQNQEDFELVGLQPKQGMVLDLDAINTVPFEVAELEFKDVQLEKPNLDWSRGLTTTVQTFDGVKISMQLLKQGAEVFAKVIANTAENTPEEMKQKVAAFNQAKKGWVYVLSPEIYKELSLNSSDFLKPKDEIPFDPILSP